jgi:hypothetical protein
VVAATPASPDREQHDRAVTGDVVGKPVHAPAAGDLQPEKPSAQAAAVWCCKLALALMEQVEVEGDPAEVVVTEGRQPCADLGGEHQRTPSHTGNGIYRFWYGKGFVHSSDAGRSGNRQQPLLAGQAVQQLLKVGPGNAPGKRDRGLLLAALEGEQAVLDLDKIGDVVGDQDLPLADGQVDLDLV